MRKLVFLTALLLAGYTSAMAQRRFNYGFRIGGGLATQSYTNAAVQSVNAIRVLSAAIMGEARVYGPYKVRLGLGFSNKGATIFEDALTTTNKLFYAQATISIIRKFEVPTLGKLVVGTGPYFARGYHGSLDYETPSSFTTDKVTYGNDNDFKTLDEGINISTGLELNNKLTFTLGYDLGLSNIASQVLRDTGTKSIHNRVIAISLGLMF